ncbi:MAG: protein kinase [Pseudomonadota bacterium]
MNEPILFGKYYLTDQIAVGGMAEIYKAVAQGADGKRFTLAIKRILPQLSDDEEFVSMLVDEAKVMVLLNHPNIVPIIEFGKIEDSYYIAMEYIHGVTLKELFKTVRLADQSFSIDLAVHIAREIGTGLSYAHRKTDEAGRPLQIVHRDISPANILISYQGEVRIADFGIARAANQSHRTQIGIIRGKTGYMSPEQTRATTTLDQRSDIYSLGIILWELLSGERLYRAETVPEALKMIRESKVPPLRENRPEIPPELEAIAMKALTPNPEERYQRAEFFVDALNEFLTRWSPQGRPVRVTHNDLVGFLRRFFTGPMDQEPVEPDLVWLDDAKTQADTGVWRKKTPTITKTAPSRPQTLAANPLYELSEPEAEIPTAVGPQPTTSTGPTPVGRMAATENSLAAAEEGIVLGYRMRRKPIVWIGAAGIAAILLWTGARLLTSRLREEPPELSPAATPLPAKENTASAAKPNAPKTVIVELVTEPAGATVSVNGKEVTGRTPLDLPPLELKREYTVRITKPRYVPREEKILLESDRIVEKMTFTLVRAEPRPEKTPKPPKVALPTGLGPKPSPTPAAGTVRIGSKQQCKVVIDGGLPKECPLYDVPLSAGIHEIRYIPADKKYQPFAFRLKVKAGLSYKCLFDFSNATLQPCTWKK